MAKYIVEFTSGSQEQHTVEGSDMASALADAIRWNLENMLVERDEENYQGWSKIEASIGPATCDECFAPLEDDSTIDTEFCKECVAFQAMEMEA